MKAKHPILIKGNIKLNQTSVTKEAAIIAAGQLLVDTGYVTEKYIDGMLERDRNLSVYLGSYLAIPHGEFSVKSEILHSGISVMIYPEGIDWDGDTVKIVMGIAGVGDSHMEILSNTAILFSDEENVQRILDADSIDTVFDLLTETQEF